MTRTVYVVPHCHWDREWYQPHELFRWRLVQMIDELLDHMEGHPEFRAFTLDGQSIVIDDYLELRPENEARLRALIEAGRVVIGPWWVQPDEFLPTGESHIRSLQRGIRRAEALGGCLRVGHCADQFGHIAQMPQIMSQLGLTSVCLWRGVPDEVPGWSFWWEAPDGTRLPVLYLRNSYSSGWRLPPDLNDLLERVRREERDLRDDEPALLMNGTDHSRMQKDVPAILSTAAGHGYDFRLVTLAEFERARLAAGIDEYVNHGELRSPDRSNVLVGVLSARPEIKLRDFEVAAALERYAEPLELLAHLHNGPDGLPALKHAWRLLLENSPHDSICGCSVDQTHREMFPRYDRAEQLARQVARESMAHLVTRMASGYESAIAFFRPVANAPVTLECTVPAEWSADWVLLPGGDRVPVAVGPLQPGHTLTDQDLPAEGARRHLDFIREGRRDAQYVESMRWQLTDRQIEIETLVGTNALNVIDDETVRREVRNTITAGLADTAHVVVRETPARTLRAVLPAAPRVGIELLRPAPTPEDAADDLSIAEESIANAFYEVRFRKGRLAILDWQHGIEIENVSLFVDEGDRGDEYNADILPDAIAKPSWARLVSTERDLVSATLRYVVLLKLPGGLRPRRKRRTKASVAMPISVAVTLWRQLPRIDFSVHLLNEAHDHRLRVLFPLPFTVDHAITENQLHVARRPLAPPQWNGSSPELPPTTFPQKTFAALEADGLGVAVFNRGMQEGEVVRDATGRQAYALTLLRCVGWLSRPDLTTRRGGAGPMIATHDSQALGEHHFQYALTSYLGGWRENGIQALAHAWAFPPLAYTTDSHDGSLGLEVPLARIAPNSVVPSAFHRSDADGAAIIRLYSSCETRTHARVSVPAAGTADAQLTDLLERPRQRPSREDRDWTFELRPWEIATIRLEPLETAAAGATC